MTFIRRLPADLAAGLRAGVDLLLWGHIYPRTDPALTARLTAARRNQGSGT